MVSILVNGGVKMEMEIWLMSWSFRAGGLLTTPAWRKGIELVFCTVGKYSVSSGCCQQLVASSYQALSCVVMHSCICVPGRAGVLSLHHQVLLQRCSRGSTSIWHHKVRPKSFYCCIYVDPLPFPIPYCTPDKFTWRLLNVLFMCGV